MNELDIFRHGMKREPGIQLAIEGDLILELGPGNTPWEHATEYLEWPDWNADCNPLPYDSGTVDHIGGFHFFEHVKEIIPLLRECERVLKVGGTLSLVVPFYSSNLQAKDLDHKHSFTERTWSTLFNNDYYDKDKLGWKFEVQFNMIMAVEEPNLCLCTQLVKV